LRPKRRVSGHGKRALLWLLSGPDRVFHARFAEKPTGHVKKQDQEKCYALSVRSCGTNKLSAGPLGPAVAGRIDAGAGAVKS